MGLSPKGCLGRVSGWGGDALLCTWGILSWGKGLSREDVRSRPGAAPVYPAVRPWASCRPLQASGALSVKRVTILPRLMTGARCFPNIVTVMGTVRCAPRLEDPLAVSPRGDGRTRVGQGLLVPSCMLCFGAGPQFPSLPSARPTLNPAAWGSRLRHPA